MFTTEARALLLTALAGCVLLTACDEAPDPKAAAAAAGERPKPARTTPLDEKMVAAVSSGKTAVAIGLHFNLTVTPTVNEGLPVDIALVPHQEFTSISVHFLGQDGLTLLSGDSLGPLADPSQEKVIKHQVVLMPAREGVFMINATVETTGSDGTVSRIFSIPVVVAPPGTPAAAAAPAAPAAETTAPPSPAPAAPASN